MRLATPTFPHSSLIAPIITHQMTPGELKFALLLENHLNSLPDPEYRQLVVECLMVISLVATSSPQPMFGGTLVVEHIIHHARHLFLQDQVGGVNDVIVYDVMFFYYSENIRAQQWIVAVIILVAVVEQQVCVFISMIVHHLVAMVP